MNTYKCHRFPPDTHSYAVWLYYRFNPSQRDIEDLLAKSRANRSHEATRAKERGMRKFKSVGQAQRFITAHAADHNLFNLGRHLVRAQYYRDLRKGAFGEWTSAVA